MKKVKNFFYPNKGVLGVFAVWAAFVLIAIFSNPMASYVLKDPFLLLRALAFNLSLMYFLSCLSIWIYETIKKKYA